MESIYTGFESLANHLKICMLKRVADAVILNKKIGDYIIVNKTAFLKFLSLIYYPVFGTIVLIRYNHKTRGE